jgi:hypothetical protein
MKPYGVRIVEFPNVGDISEMGAKSSAGHISGRSGDCHSNFRSVDSKARTRRHWARKARAEGKAACNID